MQYSEPETLVTCTTCIAVFNFFYLFSTPGYVETLQLFIAPVLSNIQIALLFTHKIFRICWLFVLCA